MKKVKKIIIILVVVLVVILAIVFGIKAFIDDKKNQFATIEENMQNIVEEVEVQKQDLTSYVKGVGEITSFEIKDVKVENYESMQEMYVEDGENVTEKQKLMKVEGAGTSRIVKAPSKGMFFTIDNNGIESYKIYDLNNVGVKIQVSETDVVNIKKGQKAVIKITSIGKEVQGIVDYVSNLPQNGKFAVRIKMDYQPDVRFGYSAHVSIATSEKANTLVLPYKAVEKTDDGRYYVYKASEKEALKNAWMDFTTIPEEKRTYVEVGEVNSNQVEILSGLTEGEKVVYSLWK